jgi:glycosyltransferase involved in cell wall biosynthesis
MGQSQQRVVFISYNGLLELLGHTQVIPYVRSLAGRYRMTIVSFEKPVRSSHEDSQDRRRLAASLASVGITWVRLRYHKSPSIPATLYDIAHGISVIAVEHARARIDLVHARGYVPAAMACGLKRWLRIPYLFDVRGLQPEEYVDAGLWDRQSVAFRMTKRAERSLLAEADGLVTLTDAIRPVLRALPGLADRSQLPPWEVIPCSVDLNHFQFRPEGRRRIRAQLNIVDRPVLVYAGSIGTWYLLDEMLECYAAARAVWPELFLLILSPSTETTQEALRRHSIDPGDAAIRWVRFDDMPDYLSAADAGMALIRACPSKRSSSPTKYAEYLACGLPLLINAGIGDTDSLVERHQAGVLLRAFTPEAYRQAAAALRKQVQRPRDEFRRIAETRFSLRDASEAYQRLYGSILAEPGRVPARADTVIPFQQKAHDEEAPYAPVPREEGS